MIKLAGIFSDGAVLQRNKEMRIFGECDENVTVEFDGVSVSAKCEDGKFYAVLPSHEAGVGFTLTVSNSKEKVAVNNISVGEVFIASGQSNMEMPLEATDGAEDELEHCENENISFYSIPPRIVKGEPIDIFRFEFMDYSDPTWKKCTYDTAKDFSAIGYYVAKKLQKALGVPVGVIGCNWGSRIIEAFIPTWAYDRDPSLIEYRNNYEASLLQGTQEEYDKSYEDYKAYLKERKADFPNPLDVSYGNATYASMFWLPEWRRAGFPTPKGTYSADRPGHIFHTMLEDVAPYSLNFVLWYQGEYAPGGHYYEKYGVLVNSWREAFNQDDISFYAMELAPYGEGTGVTTPETDAHYAEIRMHQRKATLDYADCHLITTMGLGDISNIHPTRKRELAYRTARSVLYHSYNIGEKSDNPYAISAKFEEDCVRVKFANDENLFSISYNVPNVYLSADGENFVLALARIENNELVVWDDNIKNPCEVRYCQKIYYDGQDIFNSAALPASPFKFKKE